MTTRKLLDRLKDILNSERKAQIARYDALKKVLKSLREKKVKLKKELERSNSEAERTEIESKLRVVSKQRKKGLKLLKDLKSERSKK
jgi:hypothetical protein